MKTEAKTKKKSFDAVRFMREQRDRISKDTADMTPEEVVAYFEQRRNSESAKKR
jgi:hypothetical protein